MQHHATPEAYKHRFHFRLGGQRSFLVLYANVRPMKELYILLLCSILTSAFHIKLPGPIMSCICSHAGEERSQGGARRAAAWAALLEGQTISTVKPGNVQTVRLTGSRRATCRILRHTQIAVLRALSVTYCLVRGRWRTAENPYGQWQTVVSEDAVVLHYAYSYRSDIADKAATSCPHAEYLAAARHGDRAKAPTCNVAVPLLNVHIGATD